MIYHLAISALVVSLAVAIREILLINRLLRSAIEGPQISQFDSLPWKGLNGQSLKLVRLLQQKIVLAGWRSRSEELKFESSGTSNSDLFNNIIVYCTRKFRAKHCLILIESASAADDERFSHFSSQGLECSSPKLTEAVYRNYINYFLFGDQRQFGLRDELLSNSLDAAFYLFGFRYVIANGFYFSKPDSFPVRGILWLGYEDNTCPLPEEDYWSKQLCDAIEKELLRAVVIEDLNTKVKAKELSIKQKSDFMTQATHDIRAPLHNINSILSLLASEASAENREMAEIGIANCKQMKEIVNSIIDFSRIQSGHLFASKSKVELSLLLQEIVNNYQISAKLKNLNLLYNQPTHSVVVEFDVSHLKRIVNNLLSNAIKYTETGSIIVAIQLNEDSSCRIVIQDSGIGISEEDLKRLFQPFARFSDIAVEGIGLGLTLSKALVRLNGAKLECKSKLGVGSEFSLTIQQARLDQKVLP